MVCEFHPSRLCRVRPGKRTFFEAEKFALQQGPWNRRTIHLNELAIRYCGMTMKPSRENLFAKIGRATSELQSRFDLVCRLLLEKKKKKRKPNYQINKTLTQT